VIAVKGGFSSDVTPAIGYPGFQGILWEIPGFSGIPKAVIGRWEIQDPGIHVQMCSNDKQMKSRPRAQERTSHLVDRPSTKLGRLRGSTFFFSPSLSLCPQSSASE
jgi:hypothetical protein